MSDYEYGVTITWGFVNFMLWVMSIVLVAGFVYWKGLVNKSSLESLRSVEKQNAKASLDQKETLMGALKESLKEKDKQIVHSKTSLDEMVNELHRLERENRDLVKKKKTLNFKCSQLENEIKYLSAEMKKKDKQQVDVMKAFCISGGPHKKKHATGVPHKKGSKGKGH